jgi:hypothetical protein
MRRQRHIVTGIGITALVLSSWLDAQTASTPTSSAIRSAARPIPFHGMVTAVDQNVKTFTISGKEKSRVFKVTEQTRITRAGRAATMKDIVENHEVSGAAWQNPDGTLDAKLVKLGPPDKNKTPAASPAVSPKP